MRAGILLPVFSLPNEYGIGAFGREAYDFVDFLAAAGQSYWQMLPLGPTSYGDSPYQSPSAFAGNPYFISLPYLAADGLLTHDELNAAKTVTNGADGADGARIDYGALFRDRYPLLGRAYGRFVAADGERSGEYTAFLKRAAYWLDDYALFMCVKVAHDYRPISMWEKDIRYCTCHKREELTNKYDGEFGFWRFLQFEFDRQYRALHAYAALRGISFIGDMPIYVAADSADVWVHGSDFLLDDDGKPTDVAGVPPDYFSRDGQLWGNPLYDWKRMADGGYVWWTERLRSAFSMFDMVRIDHFRGFYDFYAVKNGETTARHGEWRDGPGIGFFELMTGRLGKMPIIAEDLGELDEGAKNMLRRSGYPGMKVMQFAFDGENNPYLPENHIKNCIVYTGTHDNRPLYGWLESLSPEARAKVATKLSPPDNDADADTDVVADVVADVDAVGEMIIRAAAESVADTVIIPIQDYMALGDMSRVNTPSKPDGNWQWRLQKGYASSSLTSRVRGFAAAGGRLPI